MAWVPDGTVQRPYFSDLSMAVHYNNSIEVVVWVCYIISFIPGPFAVVVAVQHLFTRNLHTVHIVSSAECVKMILLCIPNFAYPIVTVVDFTMFSNESSSESIMTFVGKTFIPIFSSTWNPVFVTLLTQEMRAMIRGMCKQRRVKRETIEDHDIR